jgi:PKD repeat protein
MRIKSIGTLLLLLSSFFTTSLSFGQSAIRFKNDRATPSEDLIYREYFKEYTIATLNTNQVALMLQSQPEFESLNIEFNGQTFTFNLRAHDLRAPHYKLRAATDAGIIEMPRSVNKTYFGYTQHGNHDVRITADDDTFYGLIVQGNDAYYIEPARFIAKSAPANQYLIYRESDNIKRMSHSMCGTRSLPTQEFAPEDNPDHDDHNEGDRARACKVVQIALADDFRMFNEYGSVSEVEDHNMAVINNVLTNYDFEFDDDLQFSIVEIFVATSDPNDPWSNSNDIDNVLDSFTGWGPNGFDNTHDVASLWSARNFDGDVIGLAWLNAVCTSVRYNVLEDFTSNAAFLRVLQAHEMGHNFAANHDAPSSNFIMAPSVNNSNTWSTASINAVNNYIDNIGCLGPCSAPAAPVADFEANPTEGCTPLVVFFDDQSSNSPTSWSWSFPGGSPGSSTLQNPTVTYNTPGTFNVSLTATNSQGSNSITVNNLIEVLPDPVADFDFQVDENTVDFENLSQFADSYDWDFGDGESSTQTNPIHNYDEDGDYTVTLTASNECGSDEYTFEITITTSPFADFDSSDPEGCSPFEVDFYNFSSDNATSFLWSFPGGLPSSSTLFEPTVLYETPGTYNVTLTAYNAAGEDSYSITNYIDVLPGAEADFTWAANGLSVSFNSSASIGDNFSWTFGDGGTSTQENPTHVYSAGGNYIVTLTVTNSCGSNSFSLNVNLTGAPVPSFVASVQSGCSPLIVQFTSTSLGNPTSYNWVFQGGTPATSTLANPVVTYNSPGIYDVQLTVSNAAGSNTLMMNDFINVGSVPFSDFDYFINGLQATFTNQSQNAIGTLWLFGDGEQSNATNPIHVYTEDGLYTVTLIIMGACGNDTSTAQISIQTPPDAGFSHNQINDCTPSVVAFTNESSENATSFLWTFEGGTPSTSTAENPVITYNTPGEFDVTLIAYSAAGSDTMTWTELVSVGASPDAIFLLNTNGTTVNFQNQSDNANGYFWIFGDGNSSSEESPTHDYGSFGTYTVLLIASNDCGDDTMQIVLELSTVPNSFFSYSAHNGCAPFEVQFIDLSQNNPTSWEWTFEGGTPATSTDQNPTITYTTPGDYFVSLHVTNSQGSDVLVLDDVINVAGQPDATFLHQQVENIVSLEYQGLDYDSLHWDFGDGRADNSLNPTVEYNASGHYIITLIVYNACGSDTSSIDVEILILATEASGSIEGGWRIRPNPFNDKLVLYGEPATADELQISLIDAQGQLLTTIPFQHGTGPTTLEINATSLPNGIIFVALRNTSGTATLKGVHLND